MFGRNDDLPLHGVSKKTANGVNFSTVNMKVKPYNKMMIVFTIIEGGPVLTMGSGVSGLHVSRIFAL